MWTDFLAVGIAIISGIIAIFSLYKARQIADDTLETLDTLLAEQLKPMKNAVSRSMSDKAQASVTTRQRQALDKRIAQDVIDMQNPLVSALLDQFPNVKEYIGKNPNLLVELLPRLQALQGIEGFQITDLVNPSPSSRTQQPHPFGSREE